MFTNTSYNRYKTICLQTTIIKKMPPSKYTLPINFNIKVVKFIRISKILDHPDATENIIKYSK